MVTLHALLKRGIALVLLTAPLPLLNAQDTPYQVDIDPSDFVTTIDNAYFPHLPGMRWVYEGQTVDGLERVEIEVLRETREIMGIQATIVRDTVSIDGEIVEDTYDWLAQDTEGNVWYLGEDVSDFENGTLTSKAGSWEAGVDGALPGIVMFSDPAAHLHETYLQEYYPMQAEDTAVLLSVTGSAEIPFGAFTDVVMTYDYTPLNTDSHEIKYFASGVGEIQSIDLTTGDTVVLIDFTAP